MAEQSAALMVVQMVAPRVVHLAAQMVALKAGRKVSPRVVRKAEQSAPLMVVPKAALWAARSEHQQDRGNIKKSKKIS